MIYAFKDGKLKETETKEDWYHPEQLDPRHYFLTYVYQDNEIEQILHQESLNHLKAIKTLYWKSKKLSTILSAKDLMRIEDANYKLIAHNTILEYDMTPITGNKRFGYIYLPHNITEFQKDFLQNQYPYFETYQMMFILQYKKEKDMIDTITNTEDKMEHFLPILERIIK